MTLRRAYIILVFILGVSGGCQSPPLSESVPLSQVLAGPYTLRLTLDRLVVAPGETVNARLEFTNSGRTDLWIPRQSEIAFGYEKRDGAGVLELTPSACDGLEFVRVRPGRTIAYTKGFAAPREAGAWEVYVTNDAKVKAPLVVN